MSIRRLLLRAGPAVLVVLLVAGAVGVAPVAAEPPGPYAPPVDGPVVDPWRPSDHAYGAGNRGIDLDAAIGEAVRAAAPGEVAFAGPVGGAVHVVVAHADGLRTSYSFLAAATVGRGDHVGRGATVGVAAGPVHFGVRAGDRYLDPGLLLAGDAPEVHLVPVEPASPGGSGADRRWLVGLAPGRPRLAVDHGGPERRTLAALTTLGPTSAAAGVPGQLAELARAALGRSTGMVPLAVHLRSLQERIDVVEAGQESCTPVEQPPPHPGKRRVAVLVAGFGSASGSAAVLGVDTAALGYAPADVVQFSYRGGRAPDVGGLAEVEARAYGPADASGDLVVAGERLRRLLADVAAARPGVPVDVIAHSQGGLVARQALADPSAAATVESLITLGTPHGGTDLATAGVRLRTTGAGRVAAWLGRALTQGSFDAGAPAVGQLAEGSPLVRALGDAGLPPGIRVTSVAARDDVVVPALHSVLRGATNVVVAVDGIHDHAALPAAAATTREIALAVAGVGPTCRDVGPDLVRAALISLAQDGFGRMLHLAARQLDRAAGLP